MEISTIMRLTADKYFQDVLPKTQVYLHHTVGGSAKSTFNYWQGNTNRVATAYIIERNGIIYEVFDPHYWAWHLGLKLPSNTIANKQSIGIELASEGALRTGNELNVLANVTTFDTEWLYAFDIDVPPFTQARKLYHMLHDASSFYDAGMNYRGYQFFDAYDEPQVASAIWLVNHLCEEFSIPKQLIPNDDKLMFDESLILNHKGVLTHANVRKDKSDLCGSWDWDKLKASF